MDLDQMAYRCPKAEVVENVRLEGYRLTFAAAGSGLATIFPEEGSHVDGVLWSLTGDCEKSLDLYEGYPDFYDKQEITVKNKDGREIKAIVYIMTKDYMQNFNPPGRSYLTGILKGCRQNQIPTEPILKAARKPPVPGKRRRVSQRSREKPDRNDEEKTKDRNLTEVFQDHLPCSDADKCRVSDLPHGISSNGEQKAGGRAEREFPGAGSSGSLRL